MYINSAGQNIIKARGRAFRHNSLRSGGHCFPSWGWPQQPSNDTHFQATLSPPSHHAVQKFDTNGGFIAQWNPQLDYALALCAGSDGAL